MEKGNREGEGKMMILLAVMPVVGALGYETRDKEEAEEEEEVVEGEDEYNNNNNNNKNRFFLHRLNQRDNNNNNKRKVLQEAQFHLQHLQDGSQEFART